MTDRKYHIHICTPYGEDMDYTTQIEQIVPLQYPVISDIMEAIGPVLADSKQAPVHTAVLNIADMRHCRVVEFLADGHPHVAIVRAIKESLQMAN